jgi:hypothetical protein
MSDPPETPNPAGGKASGAQISNRLGSSINPQHSAPTAGYKRQRSLLLLTIGKVGCLCLATPTGGGQ